MLGANLVGRNSLSLFLVVLDDSLFTPELITESKKHPNLNTREFHSVKTEFIARIDIKT